MYIVYGMHYNSLILDGMMCVYNIYIFIYKLNKCSIILMNKLTL